MTNYRQSESFEVRGEWWRPNGRELLAAFEGRPQKSSMDLEEGFAAEQSERDRLEGIDSEHACRGPLQFEPDSGFRLSLLGSSEIAFPGSGLNYSVWGRSKKGGRLSLLDCFQINMTTNLFGAGFADRELFGHVLLAGAHVDDIDDFCPRVLEVRMPGLLEFLQSPAHSSEGDATPGLGREGDDRYSLTIGNGELTFVVGESVSHTRYGSATQREALVSIELSKPLRFAEWRMRWLEPLVRLLVFATRQATQLDRVAAIEGTVENEPFDNPVQVLQYLGSPERELKFREHRFLVNYASLGSEFDEFLRRWWDLHARLGSAGDFLFGVLRGGLRVEPSLVTLASVVEGYHRTIRPEPEIPAGEHAELSEAMIAALPEHRRKHYAKRIRHAHDPTHADRMREVVKRAGYVITPLDNKAGRLVDAVIATRNGFVHFGDKSTSALAEGRDMYEANQLMTVSLMCNLLLDLGLSVGGAKAAVTRAYGGEPFWTALHERGSAWPKKT